MNNYHRCKGCKKLITKLIVPEGRGVYVIFDGLNREERLSTKMGIPIPYEKEDHQQLIHNLFCDQLIPNCHRCGLKIGFVRTKEGRNLPIEFSKLTTDEQLLFHLGLPIEYSPVDHKFNIHLNNCEVKQLWKDKTSAKKSTFN